jgi:chromosome segregation ATPase
MRLEANLRLQEERIGEMTGELETLGEQKEAMVLDCADAREARDQTIRKCENLELEVEALEGRLEKTERERQQEAVALVGVVVETTVRSRAALETLRHHLVDDTGAQQVTLALAVAQVELKNKFALLEVSSKAKIDLQARVAGLEVDLTKQIAETKHLEQQLSDLRHRSDAKAISESQTIDQHRGEHTEQMSTLQKMLDSTANDLQEAKAFHSGAEVRHQQALEEANRSKEELESRLTVALERMQAGGELEKLRADHVEEVGCLQAQIQHAEEQLQDVRAELEALHHTTQKDLTRTKDDYEARLSQVTLQSLDATRQLEHDLVNAKFNHAENLGELEGQLKHSVEEIGRLQVRLQEEVDCCNGERKTHILELQAKAEECRRAESLEAELHHEIAVTRTQLEQTRTALQTLEAEKSALQIETTNLGAEIQRVVSLNRFMESEVKAW